MSTEAGIETVPVSSDNSPMKAHIVCGACHPVNERGEAEMGTPAICGERVLGHKSRSANCPVCLRVAPAHRMMHMGGRG